MKLLDKFGYSPISYCLFSGNNYLHKKLESQYNIDLIIIDYLQLMSAKTSESSKSNGNREQENTFS